MASRLDLPPSLPEEPGTHGQDGQEPAMLQVLLWVPLQGGRGGARVQRVAADGKGKPSPGNHRRQLDQEAWINLAIAFLFRSCE